MSSLESLAAVLGTVHSPRLLIGQQSCRCCGKGAVDTRLIRAAVELADRLGLDLTLTSGYRCVEHNAACGGHPRSKHMVGSAIDVAIPDGMDPLDYYRAACEVPFLARGGIGLDPQLRFCHHDTGTTRCWAYKDGKQVPWSEVFPSTSRE